ncbi:alpha/beta fold hydrolase [Kribbella deserti]|uniref:Alpha/beta fold hydrolase n=1 Tax=Kribbella deserti TaxID=1926257 RepID=A0ABV6QE09_9ACTN
MPETTEGRFANGLEFLRLGKGPVLVMSPGLGPSNELPTGLSRHASLASAQPFAQHFTVYVLQRRVGMPKTWELRDIATDYASAIEELSEPVLLHGASTGGSVALQVAADNPQLVRRMVIASAACSLSDRGRYIQVEFARLVAEGDIRGAYAYLAGVLAPGALRRPVGGMGWLLGRAVSGVDHGDMLTTVSAEDRFDAEPYLSNVTAPTLVLGGAKDPLYTRNLFERTAAGVTDGRAVIYEGKGHLYPSGGKASTLAAGFLLG